MTVIHSVLIIAFYYCIDMFFNFIFLVIIEIFVFCSQITVWSILIMKTKINRRIISPILFNVGSGYWWIGPMLFILRVVTQFSLEQRSIIFPYYSKVISSSLAVSEIVMFVFAIKSWYHCHRVNKISLTTEGPSRFAESSGTTGNAIIFFICSLYHVHTLETSSNILSAYWSLKALNKTEIYYNVKCLFVFMTLYHIFFILSII